MYIPTVTLEIMKRKCPRPINLKGMAIGNGAAHSPPQFLLPRACLQSLGAACAGCTGTDAGPCSPGRAVYTLEQLYLQSMVSQRTHAAIEVACADSLAFTQANAECQRLLLLAGEEAGTYNNCASPDASCRALSLALGLFTHPPPMICRQRPRYLRAAHVDL